MTHRPPPAAGSRRTPTTGPEPPTSDPAPRTWRTRSRELWLRAKARWSFLSRSLLFRVVVLTLTLSTLVMLVLGLVLQQQITTGLLQSKIDAATAEIDNARVTVENSLSGADSDPTSLREQLRLALTEIGRADGSSGAQGSAAGVFDPVIVPSRIGSDSADLSVDQPLGDVPAELRARIGQGQMSYQYTTIHRDGESLPALVVGSPARTATDSFEVYLIFPLAGEQGTVQVVQRTLLLGGVALVLALTLISALVAAQVVRPVQRAAGSARKLAAGDLAERMPVTGPIELATLATSFNAMAEAIRVQIRQLEEFGKLQRRFTSDVSHELRTPLTTVRMAADVLHAGRDEFPAHLSRATELLVDELDRFEILLGDLLEISRHDAGMAELSAEPIDIRSTITACVAAAGPLAQQSGVPIITTLPDVPVIAEIDSRRVDRILRNLINNAIDHAEGHAVEIELAADPDVLAITVTDHGVGLRPGEAGLVFNRFWRADPSRQRQTGGTGLGLAISLEDARLHGGWLQASGSPGRGSRFRLTLPRRRGGLIAGSPLPLRTGADALETGPMPKLDHAGHVVVPEGADWLEDVDSGLDPTTVPSAGAGQRAAEAVVASVDAADPALAIPGQSAKPSSGQPPAAPAATATPATSSATDGSVPAIGGGPRESAR